MPSIFQPFRKQKSLSEIEEETERAESEARLEDARYSVAQKRVMAAELRKRGLSPQHFKGSSGNTWSKIWKWLKEH